MSIQDLFYSIASAFLIFLTLFIVMGIFLLWRIQRAVKDVQVNVVEKASVLLKSRSAGFLGIAGASIIPFIISRIFKIFKK